MPGSEEHMVRVGREKNCDQIILSEIILSTAIKKKIQL